MSNLLEQASLVMIPSGYKEDVVYSQIPLDGSGDLQFTRSSNGTRVNSTGLVEDVPWNILQNSENFSLIWGLQNGVTITTNTIIAPNGTTTADTLEKASGSGGTNYYYIVQSNNTFEQITNFCYIKYKSGSGIIWLLGKDSGTFAFYDVINGTALSATGGMTTSIESVGNGWYKCIFSQTYVGATSTEFGIGLCLVDGTPNYNATTAATQSAYIWGAQSAIGSTAKPYFPTTDRLNVPRLTYQNGGGGCPSLLLEKQSTNYARNNSDLSGWTKITGTDTISLNAGTSPDGTANGINLIPSTANATHMFYDGSTSVSSAGNFTMSCYAKANGYSKFSMRESASVGYYASFNLSNGTVLDNGGNTASIENLGNGWYRCICSVVASTSVQIGLLVLSDSYTSGQPFGLTWSGDGTKGILIYGPQLEVSSSYATSLISTAGVASATRVADACSKTGISSLIGQTEGVLFVDYNYTQHGAYIEVMMSLQGATTASYFEMYYTNNTLNANIYNTGSAQAGYTSSAQASGRYKVAFAYKANDFAMYINGTQVMTDSSGTVPTLSKLAIGYDFASGLYQFGNSINQAILFPTRLTNAELASLTTI